MVSEQIRQTPQVSFGEWRNDENEIFARVIAWQMNFAGSKV